MTSEDSPTDLLAVNSLEHLHGNVMIEILSQNPSSQSLKYPKPTREAPLWLHTRPSCSSLDTFHL